MDYEYNENTIITSDSLIAEAIKDLNEKDKELIVHTIATLKTKLFILIKQCEKLKREKASLYEIVVEKTNCLADIDDCDNERENQSFYNDRVKQLTRKDYK